VWRKLKKFGAIQLKASTYVLPDEPTHYERFQWLTKEIVDTGGEATLVRVKDIEAQPSHRNLDKGQKKWLAWVFNFVTRQR
jgi:hypothetical protein